MEKSEKESSTMSLMGFPLIRTRDCRVPVRAMTAEEYEKLKKNVLSNLRKPTDPIPRSMQHGTGKSGQMLINIKQELQRVPGSRPVRGYKLLCGEWNGKPMWRALFWYVVEHPLLPNHKNALYKCVTLPNDPDVGKPYIFVPSSRAFPTTSDDSLLSGRWYTGSVLGGDMNDAAYCCVRQQLAGRIVGVIGFTPEDVCLARVAKLKTCMAFRDWYIDRKPEYLEMDLAEVFGFNATIDDMPVPADDIVAVRLDAEDMLSAVAEILERISDGDLTPVEGKKQLFSLFDWLLREFTTLLDRRCGEILHEIHRVKMEELSAGFEHGLTTRAWQGFNGPCQPLNTKGF